jgi:Tfp pilus assembly protein PilE
MIMKLDRHRCGLISIEILVVISVLAVMSGITTAAAGLVSSRSRRAHLLAMLRETQMASDMFFAEAGRFPVDSNTGLWPKQLEFTSMHAGVAFVPSYLRREPQHSAAAYGLEQNAGDVNFGVTVSGRIFATQWLPAGWGDPGVLAYTVESLAGPIALSLLDPGSPGSGGEPETGPSEDPVDEAACIELALSSNEAPVGSEVSLSIIALTAASAPAVGVQVTLTLTGCLSGTRTETLVTGPDGTCLFSCTSTQAELMTVTATAIRTSASLGGQAQDRLACLHPLRFPALGI